ncbi:PKD domain-containing protein [Roseateles sp. YR242]|uniref:PKD domain-containing protein n=1 Tax=Roseateles sp. YR242 TaxID=1855305 RepID=UPI0008CAD24B|nr:PKD domain-containing protein [Roseateles sp. YR242]SEK62457.1 PKD domain-containing protein [Roseateles sp. YR242]
MFRVLMGWRQMASCAALVLLSACGGGGGDGGADSGSSSPPPTSTEPPSASKPLGEFTGTGALANGGVPAAGDAVVFKLTGQGSLLAVTWDFGDGVTTTVTAEPSTITHAYASGGDFNVKATLSGAAGDKVVLSFVQTVRPRLLTLDIKTTAASDATTPLMPGALVRFAPDVEPGIWTLKAIPAGTRFRWTFSDGQVATTPAVTRSFLSAGNYSVELTMTDPYDRTVSARRTLKVADIAVRNVQANFGGTGSSNNGPLSLYGYPDGMARDARGNTFIMDANNYVIRRIAPDGTVSNFAGASGVSGTVDGVGEAAQFDTGARSLAIDASGTLYTTGSGGLLRTVSPDGSVKTQALASLPSDEPPSLNRSYFITDLATGPDGSVYIAEDRRVLRIKDGRIQTVAGVAGRPQVSWVDGPAAQARFAYISALAVRPNGEILVLDSCYGVRKIAVDGVVSTVQRYADSWITPDNTNACSYYWGKGLALAADGSVYMSWLGDVRRIAPDDTIRTVATGLPGGRLIVTGPNTAWVSSAYNGLIYQVDLTNGLYNVVAGRRQDAADEVFPPPTASTSEVYPEYGIASDERGDIFFSHRGGLYRYYVGSGPSTLPVMPASSQGLMVDGPSGDARIRWATSVATDASGNLYFLDGQSAVRRRAAVDGSITTLAGSVTSGAPLDGVGAAARFRNLSGLAVSTDGVVYVMDDYQRLARITPDGRVVTLTTMPERYGASLAVSPSGQLVMGYLYNLYLVAADGALTPVAVRGTGASPTQTFGDLWPTLVFQPDGTFWIRDYAPQSFSQVLRRLDSSGTLVDTLQATPLAYTLFANREPMEVGFNLAYVAARPDGSLMVYAGRPHSWWILDRLPRR